MLCSGKYILMIDQLDLIDSYRELVSIYVIRFVASLYLILLIWCPNIRGDWAKV